MAARTNPAGDWCSPTREIARPRLSRLIDECRRREPVVAACPAAAVEHLERARCNNMLIDLRSLDEPDACAIAEEVAALDRGLPALLSEPEVEEATATLMYAPVTRNALPPAAALAQRIATAARRGRQRVARVRSLLRLGAVVVLCLGVLVVLRLGPWQLLGD
jgi:hypothetical protein